MSGRRFTLIEIIAVTVIILMISAVAVNTLHEQPPSFAVQSAADDFALFCSRARMRAMERGCDMAIVFVKDDNRFDARESWTPPVRCAFDRPLDETPAARAPADPLFSWRLPEKFLLNSDSLPTAAAENAGELEIFRFFPDGGAAGSAVFQLSFDGAVRNIGISPLSGTVAVNNEK